MLVLPGDTRLVSHVEDLRNGDTVVIAPPSREGIVIRLERGEQVALEWTTARGLVRGEGYVAAVAELPAPIVHVKLESSRIAQRRDHVRVEIVLDLALRQTASVPVSCQTVDVSGGGMRAFVPLDLRPGEPVDVTIELPDEAPVELLAEVIRGSEEKGYAFRFVKIDRDERERLIRFVFAAHTREFAVVRRDG